MPNLYLMFRVATIIFIIYCFGCKSDNPNLGKSSNDDCIERILAEDSRLGTKRNHECERIPLDQTIQLYIDSLLRLDFNGCPENFKSAFLHHIEAWNNMIPITRSHGELRGEMHDLFDIISSDQDSTEFKVRLKSIWDTWGEVEKLIPLKEQQ